jgi:small subunit ribosomal protein S1
MNKADEASAMQKFAADNQSTAAGTTNLGALLKAKMDSNKADA